MAALAGGSLSRLGAWQSGICGLGAFSPKAEKVTTIPTSDLGDSPRNLPENTRPVSSPRRNGGTVCLRGYCWHRRVSTHRATRWWSSSSTQCGEDSVQRDANAQHVCYETRCTRRRRRRPLKRLSRQHKNTRPTSPPRRRRRRMAEPCASGALACSVETIARCTLRATRWWGGRRLSAM